MPKLMCIVPANLEELRTKNVDFGILMRDLNGYWDEVITVHPFCKSTRRITLSARHTVIEFRKWDPTIVPLLVELIKRRDITTIKAHDPFLCGLLGLVLSRLCRIPYVVAIYSSYNVIEPMLRFRFIDRIVNRIAVKGATLVFIGNKPARQLALSIGVRADKIRQARSANVWSEYFNELRERKNNKATVLFVGRLSTEKFVADVVKAFSVIVSSIPEAELQVCGGGDVDIDTQIKELGLADRVTLFGFQTQEQVRKALLSADVILIPLGGNIVVEACLSQTPIVAYDVDWHPELIEHNVSGLLAPFRDWHTMGEMAIRLLRDRKLSTRLGEEARARALQQRHPNTLYRIEAQAFDEIIGRKR